MRGGDKCVSLAADGGDYVRLSARQTPESFGTKRSIFLRGVETGTLLYPLARLDDTVSVQVGTEVAMPADGAPGVENQQLADEKAQRLTLIGRAGIGSSAVGCQPAFVGNADGAGVEAANMGADTVERAHRKDDAFAGDEEVITTTVEIAAAVFRLQIVRCETAVAAGSGAMYYDQVDTADTVQTEHRHAVGRHTADGCGNRRADDSSFHGQKGEPKAFSIIPA